MLLLLVYDGDVEEFLPLLVLREVLREGHPHAAAAHDEELLPGGAHVSLRRDLTGVRECGCAITGMCYEIDEIVTIL